MTELNIDPPYHRTKPRPVCQFKKANWEAIRQQIRSCWTSFSENSPSCSVNENWLKFKFILNQINAWTNLYQLKCFPLGKIYLGYPNHSSHLFRKKIFLYRKAKRTHKADLWAKYKLCKRRTQRAIRSAKWSFLKNKLFESLEQKNSKPLWRYHGYIKSKRQDGNSVSLEGKQSAAFR